MPRAPAPREFDLEKMLSYKVSMLYNRIHAGTTRQIESEGGLVTREWRVLALIRKLEPVAASDLVARSPMDKASVSRAVASLSRRKLVTAQKAPEDGRVQRLALTPAGRRLHDRIAPLSVARQRALLEGLSASERSALFKLLDKLIGRADDLLR